MPKSVRCAMCRRSVPQVESYLLRMEVLADPGTPDLQTEAAGGAETVAELLEQIKDMTAEELQDQVYRRMEFRLCGRCQKHFLANPLSRPKPRWDGRN